MDSNKLAQLYWAVDSWQKYKVTHLPFYNKNYIDVCNKIVKQSIFSKPIVKPVTINKLSNLLANAIKNNSFIIQAGDCAEMFSQANKKNCYERVHMLEKLSSLINNKNVIVIGRFAGQYSKPRNNNYEEINGYSYYNYFGDMFNSYSKNKRLLNPKNMVTAHKKALLSYNFIKLFNNNFYTSHECLNLFYEQAVTKKINNKYYNLSAHMLWLGDKTRFLSSAHVEYLRGIENPIGIKLSNNITPLDFVSICKQINPSNKMGKLVVINRMGTRNTKNIFGNYVQEIIKNKLNVLYIIDPMHGNNKIINGIKTRLLEDIRQEIVDFNTILNNYKQYFAGIHLETSHNNISECNLRTKEDYNSKLYLTSCDPRLNLQQASNILQLTNSVINSNQND